MEKTKGVILHAPLPSTKSSGIYLGPLPIVLVLAGEVHVFKPAQYLADAFGRVSQHGLQGNACSKSADTPTIKQRTVTEQTFPPPHPPPHTHTHTRKSNSGHFLQKSDLCMCCIPSAGSCLSETPTSGQYLPTEKCSRGVEMLLKNSFPVPHTHTHTSNMWQFHAAI